MMKRLPLVLVLLTIAGCNAPPEEGPSVAERAEASDRMTGQTGTVPADADLTPVQPAAPQPQAAAPLTPSVRFYRVQDPFLVEGPGRFIKGTSSQVHLMAEPFLDESAIASAKAVPGSGVPGAAPGATPGAGAYHVQVWFTDAGAQTISAVTSAHPGEQIAIVVNGEVVAAPKVRGTIERSALIAGEFSRAQAEALAAGLEKAAKQ